MPSPVPIHVAFVNENTLGHTSYLPRFVRELERCPELGVIPHLLDVTPLPARLQRRADWTLRGVRKAGLDFQIARWRRIVSTHARNLLDEARRQHPIAGVVVNTQSVGLNLSDLPPEVPLLVCLDATFAQLARSPWFAPNRVSGWLLPLTLAPIRGRERRLLNRADGLWVWSAPVRRSLLEDYGLPEGRIEILPPSLDVARLKPVLRPANPRPRLLFLGGDFRRKGGPLLLEAFRSRYAGGCDLHVITQSPIPEEPGVRVYHGVAPGTEAWFDHWRLADAFIFPSTLETFGIVLVEALAFGVPVISSAVGAAADILEDGRNGILLTEPGVTGVTRALDQLLGDPGAALERTRRGRARVERDFDLTRNTVRLAERVRELARPLVS